LQPWYFDNQAFFASGFPVGLETDFRRLSGTPICSTESLKAVKEMHITQMSQLQLATQTLMTDYLQPCSNKKQIIVKTWEKAQWQGLAHKHSLCEHNRAAAGQCTELYLCNAQNCNTA